MLGGEPGLWGRASGRHGCMDAMGTAGLSVLGLLANCRLFGATDRSVGQTPDGDWDRASRWGSRDRFGFGLFVNPRNAGIITKLESPYAFWRRRPRVA